MYKYILFVIATVLFTICAAHAQEAHDYDPDIAEYSPEAVKAIDRFEVPEGMKTELFAAEPMLANPVCFYVDHQGRFYVAETFRHHQGVTDMREHTEWLLDDLASRTVEERLIAMKKNLGTDFPKYTIHHDRVRLITDTDGDGKADKSTVFADGFKDALSGIGAGLLTDGDAVYFTCIPELWRLEDTNGDGVAEEREVLSSGYGVHINFLGHDLHGLRKGPDGRLYFSIGDRGLHVKTFDGEVISEPDTGAVLRCWPDGSGLEIYHTGLRNPQELVFDNYGNLWTGDNNSDGGDLARLVWLVPGGDSGWHIGWQWIREPNPRGPWNSAKMWEPHFDGQPAHHLPPIANIGAGPSGFAYYPGTGMPDRYDGYFFLCDFRGDANRSLVHAFTVEPKGASFEMVDRHDFANHMLATDVDFGMEPGLYFSDWIQGWEQPKRGRIYRIFDPELEEDAASAETKRLLGEGMSVRKNEELTKLLSHSDQRVRLEAQYELARRPGDSLPIFLNIARDSGKLIPRLHGLWGIWQLILQDRAKPGHMVPFLQDSDAEIRAQAAKILGDVHAKNVSDVLVDALTDKSDRVRFFAATALGQVPRAVDRSAANGLIDLLRVNNNEDVYLRHAAVFGLAQQAAQLDLARLANDRSAAVRLGALLALRQLKSPLATAYLRDPDPFVELEAARAINDGPIPEGMRALARHPIGPDDDVALVRRVLNANLRAPSADSARRLAAFAATMEADTTLRAEALDHLAEWTEPYPLDAVTGLWRPTEGGALADARAALGDAASRLLDDPETEIRAAAAELAGRYGLLGTADVLLAIVKNDENDENLRIAALQSLDAMDAQQFDAALAAARDAAEPRLKMTAVAELATVAPEEAVGVIGALLDSDTADQMRAALDVLATIHTESADALLAEWTAKLVDGDVPGPVQLDVLRAARGHGGQRVSDQLSRYDAAVQAGGPIAPYRVALEGGDAREGWRVFFQNPSASCQRCHAIDGQGGIEVGPDLSTIGARKDREYLLRSIVTPNSEIAEGFENVTLEMADGHEYVGRVIEENDEQLVLEIHSESAGLFEAPAEDIPHSEVDVVAEGDEPVEYEVITLDKKEIASRERNLSSMPTNLVELLTLDDLRDVVAFLASRGSQ